MMEYLLRIIPTLATDKIACVYCNAVCWFVLPDEEDPIDHYCLFL